MSAAIIEKPTSLASRLPQGRGRLSLDVAMSGLTWFRVGGMADAVYVPADADDLATFLQGLPSDVPVTVVGVGSNLLVRDGGVRGLVLRLGAGLGRIAAEDGARVRAGAAALDVAVARRAAEASIAGLEFMRGIPGAVGGALIMNAGAYGCEVKDVLIEATAIDRQGQPHVVTAADMGHSYRHSDVPEDFIFVEALFQGWPGERRDIEARMSGITEARDASQPVRSRTGGSTFKNPDPEQSGGRKAWLLIDEASCRGLVVGDAQVSEQHCNFLINRGKATAADLENLGERVRTEVEKKSGIKLEWEIRRIGQAAEGGS